MRLVNMRTYVLTDHEKQIITAFLKDDLKLQDFRVMKHLALKLNVKKLHRDVDLIEAFRRKVSEKTS